MIGEVQRRLPGRISGADEENVEAMHGARFAALGAVVDALADEPIKAVDRQAPPRDAGCQNDRSCAHHVAAAVESDFARRRIDAGDQARDQDFRAEPTRLLERAAGKLVARDPIRKAEIVLDPRRHAGLSPRDLALDDNRAQPFGCAVDRRRQARRSAADDRDIVFRRSGARPQAEAVGKVAHLRPEHHVSVSETHRRPVAIQRHRFRPEPRQFRRIGREPIERNLVAGQETAQVVGRRIPARTDHDDARLMRLGGNGLQPPDPLARQRAHRLRDFL
jgi:hypothetical protein